MSEKIFSLKNKVVWVAGHSGLVGKALVRKLKKVNCKLITIEKNDLDLTDQSATWKWMRNNKIDIIFLAAAKVGGILANKNFPAEFLYINLAIQNNIIEGAKLNNIKKLIFLGSSCIYPKFAEQPIKEKSLMTGPLEQTNEAYAIAKIAGLKLCSFYREQYNCNFISTMPTNLYGPGDNFEISSAHVMGSLINKIVTAKIFNQNSIEIWGSGKPRREFLYVDDLADALCFLAENYHEGKPINIGYGKDISILELAQLISKLVDWKGNLTINTSKPDGTPLKRLNIDKIKKLGWEPRVKLEDGIKSTIKYFIKMNNFKLT